MATEKISTILEWSFITILLIISVGTFFSSGYVGPQVYISEGPASNLPPKSVLVTDPKLHDFPLINCCINLSSVHQIHNKFVGERVSWSQNHFYSLSVQKSKSFLEKLLESENNEIMAQVGDCDWFLIPLQIVGAVT